MAELLAGMHADEFALPMLVALLAASFLSVVLLIWRGPRRLALAGLVVVLGAVGLLALRPATVTATGFVLRIEGAIRPSTVDDVRRVLGTTGVGIVELRSGFGLSSIEAARRVAGLLRDRGVVTTPVGLCTSACAILYLAGAERELPSDPAASLARLVFGPGVDWAAELRRFGVTETFTAVMARHATTAVGFAPAQLIEANVVTRVRPGGLSFFCVRQAGGRTLDRIATSLPGRAAWHSRTLSPYGGACGSFVRLDGEAGRLDVRLELQHGGAIICRDVVLRGIGDFLSLAAGEEPTLEIERRTFGPDPGSDEPRRQVVRCA